MKFNEKLRKFNENLRKFDEKKYKKKTKNRKMTEFYNMGNSYQPVGHTGMANKRPRSDSGQNFMQKKRNENLPVPKGTLLIGDSMIRLVNPDEVNFFGFLGNIKKSIL